MVGSSSANRSRDDEENQNEDHENESAGPRASNLRFLWKPNEPEHEERKRVLLARERIPVENERSSDSEDEWSGFTDDARPRESPR